MAERALSWLAFALLLRRPSDGELQQVKAFVRRHALIAVILYMAWTAFTTVPALLKDRSLKYWLFAIVVSQMFAWLAASAALQSSVPLVARSRDDLRRRGKWAAVSALPVMVVTFLAGSEGDRWFIETFASPWWLVPLAVFIFWLLHHVGTLNRKEQLNERWMAATEARLERQARARAEAELRLLQAQVEPHFLYNTLANLRYLVQTGSRDALAMTDALIDYLRASVPSMRANETTIGKEADQVLHYLTIMQMRMQGRLTFSIDVDETVRDVPIPPLILLTLVENAIKHGIAPLVEGGSVIVRAQAAGHRVRIEVLDNGGGLASQRAPGHSTQAGLANIRERLSLTYGDQASFSLAANEPRGVRALLELPRGIPAAADGAVKLLAPQERDQAHASRRESWVTEVDGLAIRATLLAPGEAELWVNEVLEDKNAVDPQSLQVIQPFLFAAVPGSSGSLRRIRVDWLSDALRIFVDGREPGSVAYVESPSGDDTQGDHRG